MLLTHGHGLDSTSSPTAYFSKWTMQSISCTLRHHPTVFSTRKRESQFVSEDGRFGFHLWYGGWCRYPAAKNGGMEWSECFIVASRKRETHSVSSLAATRMPTGRCVHLHSRDGRGQDARLRVRRPLHDSGMSFEASSQDGWWCCSRLEWSRRGSAYFINRVFARTANTANISIPIFCLEP